MANPKKDIVKKEIDKDIMYRKIMPSNLKALREDIKDNTINYPLPEEKFENPSAPKGFNDHKPIHNASRGVQINQRDPAVLVNIMEALVVDKLEAAFAKFNCCKCDKCKKDVAAIALNRLKPKYVVAGQDEIPEFIKNQANIEVTTAIVQAILIVRGKPRH